MKNFLLLLTAVLWSSLALTEETAAQHDYYFSDQSEFDESIPTPWDFLGYDIGTHYTRHDRIVDYFRELARISDKVKFQEIGQTVELRPQVVLTVTSPENHNRLEEIRSEHLTLIDPNEQMIDIEEAKSIVALNYSVHGNESSSGEAALLTAYYLVANQSDETEEFLNEAVIHIDPAQNPDGRDRAANWHNQYKSFPPVADPADMEHNEAWPRGRTNHFLHDLNRDWFAVTQQESENRVRFYQKWYPNIQIDFHEMGTNSTYYLEPTQPVRTWNPIIPEYHYEVLNPLLAGYHTEALDGLGALYWTKEVFDNISPIYGSTYPDILGGVGVTFEVGSSRGLIQESDAGDVTFSSTIRRHLVTGIATVRAAVAEKQVLMEYQKDFFQSAVEEAEDQPVRAYLFGDETDQTLTDKFLDLLLKHNIEVYAIDESQEVNGDEFTPGNGFIVPTAQAGYRVIHDIFEPNTTFADSVFYDITAWSLVQGYGTRYEEIRSGSYSRDWGARVDELPERTGTVVGSQSNYAYVMKWGDYNAPAALYRLLDEGLTVRTAHRPFTALTRSGEISFGYGSLSIAVTEQSLEPGELYRVLREVADEFSLDFYSVETGLNRAGIDLGSGNMNVVDKPQTALVMGNGVNSYDAGEAWFLLNRHLGLNVTKLDSDQFPGTSLQRYNTILLVDGNYNGWSDDTVNSLKEWIRNGGVLITSEGASEWAVEKEIVSEKLLAEDSTETPEGARYNFEERADRFRANTIPGVILKADIDPSHPLAFGVSGREQLFLKSSSTFLTQSSDPYATVAQYTGDPLAGGFVNSQNLDRIRNKAAIVVKGEGQGNVILFSENPTFRSYWHTTDRLLLNAILFGRNM